MLSNFCDDDRITFCLFVNLFDHIRTGQTFRMIGKREFCFIFLDLFDPFGVFLLWQFFINCRKHFFDISNHTFIDNDILVHLCHINIKLENFCITCKFIWITCDTVGESCTDYDQKIAFTDSKVRCLGTMHTKHSCIKFISSRKCTFSHQGITYRTLYLVYECTEFFTCIR